MQYLLKINRLGSNAVILALALGDDKPTSFDVTANDFISPSSLPISSTLFKINVIQKLAPGVYKEGYEVSSQTTRESRERPLPRNPLRDDPIPRPSRPYPLYDPLAAEPRRPVPPGDFAPPGFEDEFEIQRPPRGYPPGWGGRNPLNIGDRDLYPPGLGPHDPLRGGIGPGLAPGGEVTVGMTRRYHLEHDMIRSDLEMHHSDQAAGLLVEEELVDAAQVEDSAVLAVTSFKRAAK
ncbi:hypothetical protein EYZ11_003173 [Aspergillus tanneri]|uniref:PI31 proteasome regulator N-terminal domain-containing protein n=1 Tax=Aspergillus tanneri TaxID=1220188 RepID=A0A4S3JNT3_9EURO|nr:hypothetical protein EYZ11_003173 [Aspergillus tanneri]